MRTADKLRSAADLIERDGWCRWVYVDSDGSHCAIGALLEATDGDYDDALVALQNHLDNRSVAFWNDHFSTSAENVIEALRNAADEVEMS